jgi:hypothetical protein
MGMRTAILLTALLLVFPVAGAADVDVPAVVAQCNPSVVLITIYDSQGQPLGTGSGFVVAPGLVATCHHVVEHGAQARVKTHDRIEYSVEKVVATSAGHDIALLSVPKMQSAPALGLRELSTIEVGEDAIAIGSPLGLQGTVTTGVVSAVREDPGYGTVVQTSAATSPGNSGGPLVDGEGRVLGVISFGATRGQNLNFAVASSELEKLMAAPPTSPEVSAAAKLLRPKEGESHGRSGYLEPRTGTWTLRVPKQEPYTAALPTQRDYIMDKVNVSSRGQRLSRVDDPEQVTISTYCASDLGVFWFDSTYAGEKMTVSVPYFPRRVAVYIWRDDTGGDLREIVLERFEFTGDEPLHGAEVDTVLAKYGSTPTPEALVAMGRMLDCAHLIGVSLLSQQGEYDYYKNIVTVQVNLAIFDLNAGRQLAQEAREDYFVHGKLAGFRHDRRLIAEEMIYDIFSAVGLH